MRLPDTVRRAVAQRASGRCEYCRCLSQYSSDDFAIDHIRPRSSGGPDEMDNRAWSCQGGNSRKYTATQATDPVTGRRPCLFHPRRQTWDTHFRWSDDTLTVIGRMSCGRATLARLELNRPSVVNLRRALSAIGEHP